MESFPLVMLTVATLSIQLLAPYLIWWNRWNVPTHIQAGFCVTAYVIPGLLTNVWDKFPTETLSLYLVLNLVGAIALCAGVLLSAVIWNKREHAPPAAYAANDPYSNRITKRVLLVISICVVGIYLAYYIMGFIPMFAEDPFSAKQFKGMYRDMYYRAAYLFRFTFSIIQASIPLLLMIALVKRSLPVLAITFLAFFAILISLARGATATGMLIFVGIVAAQMRGGMRWYIPLVLLIFPFGSIFYYFLGQVMQVEALTLINTGETLSEFISVGAPDIPDQLGWLNGFTGGDYFSWGRTIYGGLIPGNYPWNPAVWTLTYNDIGADISEIVSGGLRLTPAEWGFANFGWIGVVLLPMASGLIQGFTLLRLKHALPEMNRVQATTAIMLYTTLGAQLTQFYLLSIHSLPAIAATIYFWRAAMPPRPTTLSPAAAQRPTARYPGQGLR